MIFQFFKLMCEYKLLKSFNVYLHKTSVSIMGVETRYYFPDSWFIVNISYVRFCFRRYISLNAYRERFQDQESPHAMISIWGDINPYYYGLNWGLVLDAQVLDRGWTVACSCRCMLQCFPMLGSWLCQNNL